MRATPRDWDDSSCFRRHCPPEILNLFVTNELRETERQEVEKHCALCDPCREQLVDVLRGMTMAPTPSELACLTQDAPCGFFFHNTPFPQIYQAGARSCSNLCP